MLYYEKYLAVTSFAILLTLYCYFCASIVSAVLFMCMYRQYIYTKQIELFLFLFFLFFLILIFDFDFFDFIFLLFYFF